MDIAAAHVNDPVPPLPDTVDLQLRQFVMSMLEKDPRDRPKDALVVSRTLARIERRLLDQQTEASDDTFVAPPSGRMPRRVASAPHAVNTLLRAMDPKTIIPAGDAPIPAAPIVADAASLNAAASAVASAATSVPLAAPEVVVPAPPANAPIVQPPVADIPSGVDHSLETSATADSWKEQQ